MILSLSSNKWKRSVSRKIVDEAFLPSGAVGSGNASREKGLSGGTEEGQGGGNARPPTDLQ